ncbi:hypothetical protein BGLCM_1022 [Bifidobacterium gallicum DSM 20093 = LMG 11596]|uniref:Uncharacterized protein n=1 Tax=Bifidobacterium gallicum DSM 20093 = LMG 11596 TaxID=561180 RepID=A0A087AIX9_9BIFI|nr:hypothetical protein BGLCM_1022 [Bifidobacterium gallicum DSM 20093 = LMG 11596]
MRRGLVLSSGFLIGALDEGEFHVAGDLLERLLDLPSHLVGRHDRAADVDGLGSLHAGLRGRGLLRVGQVDGLLVDFEHVGRVEAHALLALRRVRTLDTLALGIGVAQVVALSGETRALGGPSAGQASDGGQ